MTGEATARKRGPVGHEARRSTIVRLKGNIAARWGRWVGSALAQLTLLGVLLLFWAIFLVGLGAVILALWWLQTILLLLVLAR